MNGSALSTRAALVFIPDRMHTRKRKEIKLNTLGERRMKQTKAGRNSKKADTDVGGR
jgi:hypothetical protein